MKLSLLKIITAATTLMAGCTATALMAGCTINDNSPQHDTSLSLDTTQHSLPMESYPFIIIRIFGSGKQNDLYTQQIFDANRRHPGLVEEIWFSGGTLDGKEVIAQEIEENLPYRDECRELGIRFSFQQGVTLNHSADGIHRDFIPEDAWAMGWDGARLVGTLCPLSPDAQEYTRYQVGEFMKHLQPDSYWPDDDMRLYGKGPNLICFCPRCIERFNKIFNHDFTREELKSLLETDNSTEAAKVREEWTISNASNLAEYASVFSSCRDEFAPECLLGIQSVFASWIYDGPDYGRMLKALAGTRSGKSAIRPGAGHYSDTQPSEIVPKGLDIQQESARCRKDGHAGQVCVEVENWPHVAATKNPYGLLTEASFMLANGADSLALYWGSDTNCEDPSLNEFFFEALNAYKPFLLSIKKAFEGTKAAGLAFYRGRNAYALPEWRDRRNPNEAKLMANAVPVVRMESSPEAYVLDERCVRELSESDLSEVLSHTLLMDIDAYTKLGERFPQLECARHVEKHSGRQPSACTAERLVCEEYGHHKWAFNMVSPLMPLNDCVKKISGITGAPECCGSCIIPTGHGGNILLIQTLENGIPWTTYRRECILDALDSLVPGGMSVRLLTSGFNVAVVGRNNDYGKCTGCYLLNLGSGRTLPLEIAIRNPAAETFLLHRPECETITLKPTRKNGDEVVFQLPPLDAIQPLLLSIQ